MAAKIKKGDTVVVLTGRDKGRTGEVIEVFPTETARSCAASTWSSATSARPGAGGRHHLQGSADPPVELAHRRSQDGKPTRVGFKILDDGRKVRVAKRSGDVIDGQGRKAQEEGAASAKGGREAASRGEKAEGGSKRAAGRRARGGARARRRRRTMSALQEALQRVIAPS
jgi:large subunit ribosomal protein L24